jgi:hypothetical protein
MVNQMNINWKPFKALEGAQVCKVQARGPLFGDLGMLRAVLPPSAEQQLGEMPGSTLVNIFCALCSF